MSKGVFFGIILVVSGWLAVAPRNEAALSPATGSATTGKAVKLRVPQGFLPAPNTQAEPYTNTGWAKEIINKKTGIEMLFIPAGEFVMGSEVSPEDLLSTGIGMVQYFEDELPQHRVRITRPFYLGKCEVTQRQWQALMGSNPSEFKGSDRLPVDMVSWSDCQSFLAKAGAGLRLPSEAEWEYACRAGTKTPFYFGNTITTDQVNYFPDEDTAKGVYRYEDTAKDVYGRSTMPVGSFPANAWGLYDMHGNVWEWCQDWYDKHYQSRMPESDPTGPSSGSERVLRGGSWFNNAEYCRSAIRSRIVPSFTYSSHTLGFRVARGLP